MKSLLALSVLCTSLIACAKAGPETITSYRDRNVPIASRAVFDPASFEGNWRVVAGFPKADTPDCDPVLSVDRTMILTGCSGGNAYAGGPARYLGQGRYTVDADPMWVLWLAEDGQAAVIGTPDGSMGAILARDTISADRYRAAVTMLDFNGYKTDYLLRY